MSFKGMISRQCPCARQWWSWRSPSRAFSTTIPRRIEAPTATATATEESAAAAASSKSTRRPSRPVPPPLPFVPDVKTFLTLIGRKSSEHVSKIPSWDALFTMTSTQLRHAGVEPPRLRRYICWARERFRQGVYGIGGDFQHVQDGRGVLQVVEVELGAADHMPRAQAGLPAALRTPGKKAVVVNVPHDVFELGEVQAASVKPVAHVKWLPQYNRIQGSYAIAMPNHGGRRATVSVLEGLWEQKRGRKVDGGERRRAEVRAKRRAKENKDARAAAQ